MSEVNGVMMQYFHWYILPDGQLWNQFAKSVEDLAKAGITAFWFPPAYKGTAGGYDVGYGTYDLFDLGEFDQKGSIRTKYGTKEEYLNAVKAAHEVGTQVYADAVFNHKMGADLAEDVEAMPFDLNNHNNPIGQPQTIKAWTHFTFPSRAGKYSTMEWRWWHFNAIDYNANNENEKAIFLFRDKSFSSEVDLEKGNYDYLMGCDLDIEHEDVREELKYWGEWIVDTAGVDGFRFDAVKHVASEFFQEWIAHLRYYSKKNLFAVGEYWSYDVRSLDHFIKSTHGKLALFDAPLHGNFYTASKEGKNYNLSKIFDGTLVQQHPALAVTLVENHDTQPLQALESNIESWFKPLAYALILLRANGYPCIFYADYYGAHYKDKGKDGNEYEIWLDSHKEIIDQFLYARKTYCYGIQYDYLDYPNTIGWTRLGSEEHPGGMAVVLSNSDDGWKSMEIGQINRTYIDITGHIGEPVKTDEKGWGIFYCKGGSVSVWVPKD